MWKIYINYIRKYTQEIDCVIFDLLLMIQPHMEHCTICTYMDNSKVPSIVTYIGNSQPKLSQSNIISMCLELHITLICEVLKRQFLPIPPTVTYPALWYVYLHMYLPGRDPVSQQWLSLCLMYSSVCVEWQNKIH